MSTVPLRQLNLLLWLTWPHPPYASGWRPVFYEAGFEVWGIGMTLDVEPNVLSLAHKAHIPMKPAVSPELILRHTSAAHTITVECKQSSFGPTPSTDSEGEPRKSHPSYQANALLAITGRRVAQTIGLTQPERWSGYLLYATAGGNEEPLGGTLSILSDSLTKALISATDSGALGIYHREDGLYLQGSYNHPLPANILDGGPGKVAELDPDDSGEVLQLIPLLPFDPSVDMPDPQQRQLVEERLRTSLTSAIGQRLDEATFSFTEEQVITDAIDVWLLWRDKEPKRSFRRIARGYIKNVLSYVQECAELEHPEIEVTYAGGVIKFGQVSDRAASYIRGILDSAAFRRGKFDLWGPQLELFDQ